MTSKKDYPIREGDILYLDDEKGKCKVDKIIGQKNNKIIFKSKSGKTESILLDQVPYKLVRRYEDYLSETTSNLRCMESLLSSQIQILQHLNKNEPQKLEKSSLLDAELKRSLFSVRSHLKERGDRIGLVNYEHE